ncbi:hypothetical protein BOTBODRAFT_160382 [Botryobasidium botryosum FD-172 SS1]|uniref:Ribosomal RNA-processing protein 41 n=1 Tax=Botryobasidium botryosum (strain FD-172 SS1) TaxID=930990 RepID=A0A067MFI7_BOTB1|nr:hypothetical protein BOTBODRAFT_160382 [Botryobasidium botryosum FD-172 SS1]
MNRPELLSSYNYRSDGRRPTEMRSLSLLLSQHPQADGSATVTHGLTEVMVTVFGPRESKNKAGLAHDRAVLSVTLDVPVFSGVPGGRRGRSDKRNMEFTSNIKNTFEPVIQTHLHPRSQIDINIQILQADGSLLQAAVNATTLALIDAGVPMSDYVCATTCALHDSTPLLDLNSLEENDLPNLTVAVLPRSNKVTLVTLETQLAVERFEEMLKMAVEAGKLVHREMLRAVQNRSEKLMRAIESVGGGVGGRPDHRQGEERDVEMYAGNDL